MHANTRAGWLAMKGGTRRALLSMLVLGGALTLVGCGSGSADCEDGWHRKFECGENLDGLQPQQCVDGKWESINFCALPDGTKHPEADNYPYNPDAGNGKPGTNNSGNGDPGNNSGTGNNNDPGKDDPGVERPKNADGCIELEDVDVNGGKTLTDKDCYVVGKRLTVSEGTLTIEPGVTLLFKNDVHLVIKDAGRLNAVGESGKAVWFEGTQKEAGFWGGIVFDKTGGGDNKLEHVVVRHAGGARFTGAEYSRGGININGNTNIVKVSISNSLFEQNAYAAMSSYSDSDIKIESTTFKNNELPLRVLADHLVNLGDDLTFTDNVDESGEDSNYILVHKDSTVSKKGTWPGYRYRSNGSIVVSEGIKIAPGATIEMTKGKHIQVSGDNAGLNAVGTAEKPITFTGATKRRGGWRGINFSDSNSPDNIFEHVVIEYGGDSPYTGAAYSRGALFLSSDKVKLSLNEVIFRENQYAAIKLASKGGDFTMDNVTFEKNELPVMTTPDHVRNFAENLVFDENDHDAIQIEQDAVSKDAVWHRYSVPYEIIARYHGGTAPLRVEAQLTLSPGSVLIFSPKSGFSVTGDNGSLHAVSEDANERIVMRGTDNIKGAWRGVQIVTRKATNQLTGVDILNAGDSGWTGNDFTQAGLYATSNARVILTDTTIKGSGAYGVSVRGDAELVDCSGLTVEDSTKDDFLGMTGVDECVSP